ncbi:hypothetical protein BC938DRAFT_479721 [Jimgerdemannia flammicorona]|uniref:Uncharacterized protein n=1 Tax=Jimgerdemannia flammicorona TaxID=994334 RepID=A0A433QKC0_9FUNG|nr:hypothetical protein BC938DRAFT_479721 [Jimgerdemannia flammicorona]
MYTSTHKNLTPTMPSHHFSHFYHRMQGGVKRFAYPKEVWSPAGGWWAQPKTWKSNTVVVALGMAVTCAGVWRLSAERETTRKSHSVFCSFHAVAAQRTDSVDPFDDGTLIN